MSGYKNEEARQRGRAFEIYLQETHHVGTRQVHAHVKASSLTSLLVDRSNLIDQWNLDLTVPLSCHIRPIVARIFFLVWVGSRELMRPPSFSLVAGN